MGPSACARRLIEAGGLIDKSRPARRVPGTVRCLCEARRARRRVLGSPDGLLKIHAKQPNILGLERIATEPSSFAERTKRMDLDKPIRRIVTTHDATGKAVLLSDGPAQKVARPDRPIVNWPLWVLDTSPAECSGTEDFVTKMTGSTPDRAARIFARWIFRQPGIRFARSIHGPRSRNTGLRPKPQKRARRGIRGCTAPARSISAWSSRARSICCSTRKPGM